MTSPYAFYQFWLNADDRDVSAYLRYYSMRTHAEIEELEEATRTDPARRTAQRALAQELTNLVHGEQATAAVEAAASTGGRPSTIVRQAAISGSPGFRLPNIRAIGSPAGSPTSSPARPIRSVRCSRAPVRPTRTESR